MNTVSTPTHPATTTNSHPRAARKSPPDAAPVRSRYLSFDAFLRRDFGERHVEWAGGKVIDMSPVLSYHADMSRFFIAALTTFVEVRQLGKIYAEPYLMRCTDQLPARCPDILFVKSENQNRILREYLDGPADLVIEIVSEESRARDRGAKFNEYETGGVGEYWIIDPARNRAEFYRRDDGGVFRIQTPTTDAAGNESYDCATIPGVTIRLDWLWQRPMPSVTEPLRAWGILP